MKPQFEVGRNRVGKNGVVRDPNDQAMAILQVLEAAEELGWSYQGLTWSPLLGPAGNIEYLLWMRSSESQLEQLGIQDGEAPNPAQSMRNRVDSPNLDNLKQLTLNAQQALVKKPVNTELLDN